VGWEAKKTSLELVSEVEKQNHNRKRWNVKDADFKNQIEKGTQKALSEKNRGS